MHQANQKTDVSRQRIGKHATIIEKLLKAVLYVGSVARLCNEDSRPTE
jgi:hypothetical protein